MSTQKSGFIFKDISFKLKCFFLLFIPKNCTELWANEQIAQSPVKDK